MHDTASASLSPVPRRTRLWVLPRRLLVVNGFLAVLVGIGVLCGHAASASASARPGTPPASGSLLGGVLGAAHALTGPAPRAAAPDRPAAGGPAPAPAGHAPARRPPAAPARPAHPGTTTLPACTGCAGRTAPRAGLPLPGGGLLGRLPVLPARSLAPVTQAVGPALRLATGPVTAGSGRAAPRLGGLVVPVVRPLVLALGPPPATVRGAGAAAPPAARPAPAAACRSGTGLLLPAGAGRPFSPAVFLRARSGAGGRGPSDATVGAGRRGLPPAPGPDGGMPSASATGAGAPAAAPPVDVRGLLRARPAGPLQPRCARDRRPGAALFDGRGPRRPG